MYRILMAPQTRAGVLTLQASPETWRGFARHVLTVDRPLGEQLHRQVGTLDETAPAVQLTFDEVRARRLLQLAGVSS